MSGIIVGAGILAVGGVAMGMMSKSSADKAAALAQDNIDMQNKIAAENLAFQKEEARKLEQQKDIYREMEFTNPYENIENVYEDLTVDQGQAQFQQQMFQQSQANIMEGLRGAAGASGVAGLAQAMASQGQLQAQQASISIGQQERANKMAMLGEARSIDLLQRQGEASVEEKEMNRQATLLGMQMGQLTGAQAAVQQSQQNQMSAMAAQANMYGQQAAAQMGAAGQLVGMAGNVVSGSDRKLKKNINKIGESPSGLNIYSFEFKNPKYGEGVFQGVMSDEVPQEAVGTKDGYDTVNYSMLDVEFKQI
jgi:hypothetical protein